MNQEEICRIAVLGNACGGKTTLSRRLGEHCLVPVTHVDSIQFLPGMTIRPHAESIQALRAIQQQRRWLIDGYGPLDILQERLRLASLIVLIDLPLWRHYWWCTKRQFKNLWSRRVELPESCSERSWSQIKKIYKSLWQSHFKMRPELLRILARDEFAPKVIYIRSIADWERVAVLGPKIHPD
ncbi:MAG: hypothetical protein IPM97_06950 [Bdellovibrionaceae bacterium]|nr:hypothetical protein [Pseudobdellovibrionaceae bacterium]